MRGRRRIEAGQFNQQRFQLGVVLVFGKRSFFLALRRFPAPTRRGGGGRADSLPLLVAGNKTPALAAAPSSAAPSFADRVARTPWNHAAGVPSASPLSSSKACSVASRACPA